MRCGVRRTRETRRAVDAGDAAHGGRGRRGARRTREMLRAADAGDVARDEGDAARGGRGRRGAGMADGAGEKRKRMEREREKEREREREREQGRESPERGNTRLQPILCFIEQAWGKSTASPAVGAHVSTAGLTAPCRKGPGMQQLCILRSQAALAGAERDE